MAKLTPELERTLGELMQRAQEGDQLAYARLLREVLPLVRSYGSARVGMCVWLDDFAQEVLLTIHRSRHTYDPARPFGPWLYAIARSRLVDAIRRETRLSRREVRDDEFLRDATERPAEQSGGGISDRTDEVRAALERLPSGQRQVIEMLKMRSLSVKQVASELGMSESAVKVTAHRGYQTIRKRLGIRPRE